jgi:hypothetical protein
MNYRLFIGALVGAAMMVTSAHGNTLAGDSVTINMISNGDRGTLSVTVGPGADGNYFGNQFFDFNAGIDGDRFTISSSNSFGGGMSGLGDVVTWTLSSLDFGTPLP